MDKEYLQALKENYASLQNLTFQHSKYPPAPEVADAMKNQDGTTSGLSQTIQMINSAFGGEEKSGVDPSDPNTSPEDGDEKKGDTPTEKDIETFEKGDEKKGDDPVIKSPEMSELDESQEAAVLNALIAEMTKLEETINQGKEDDYLDDVEQTLEEDIDIIELLDSEDLYADLNLELDSIFE